LQPSITDLFRASYSCIFIPTSDYEGAEEAVREAVVVLNRDDDRRDKDGKAVVSKFAVWRVTDGMRTWDVSAADGSPLADRLQPAVANATFVQALAKMVQEPGSTILVMHNVRSFINQPTNSQLVIDAALAARQKFSSLVFIGPTLEAPQVGGVMPELENIVYFYDFPLPDRKKLIDILVDKVALPNRDTAPEALIWPDNKERPPDGETYELFRKRRVYELNKDLLDHVAACASGLDPLSAENAFALSLAMTDRFDPKLIQEQKRQAIKKSQVLSFIASDETLKQVGGFQRYKDWLNIRKCAFTPEAEQYGVDHPKGVLFVGHAGTGKSLAAKATASGLGLPLLRFDMSAVFGKWVGESEGNMRAALKVAEAVAPCVLWCDEIEKAIAGSSGGAAQSGSGTTAKVVAQFLTWRQECKEAIFICFTCNDVQAIPPEFYRPGRVDAIFAVGLPNQEEKEQIFKIHLRKRKKKTKTLDIPALAEAASGFTGAEIEQTVIESIFASFTARKHLTTETVLAAIKGIVPQSKRNAEQMAVLDKWAAERAISVSYPLTETPQRRGERPISRRRK
jgi:AAA+ superfamily predicted ATPase